MLSRSACKVNESHVSTQPPPLGPAVSTWPAPDPCNLIKKHCLEGLLPQSSAYLDHVRIWPNVATSDFSREEKNSDFTFLNVTQIVKSPTSYVSLTNDICGLD